MRKDFGNKTIVVPLPVLIIGTYDENGVPNAMNAAWGTQCDYHKVVLYLGKHKTTKNLELKKAFTLSFANVENLVVADYLGIESGENINKIEKAGLHVVKSKFVDAPIIEEFPLTLECKLTEMAIDNGDFRVVGEVINMNADESILDQNGNVDFDKLKPISFDSSLNYYRALGEKVGEAFHSGLKIKNK